ncbi:hypothetical protein D5S19_22040 [Amycolatopsis panacis]|uniref:Uncharacterized protein n=1 Tax=Amycolatopsis panacis TaxID=2340917 RepID=A0A419HYX7_9PSEU|nr:hypothetical protein D5S19_22040 [Amycolatopsis panacis]
MKGPFTDSESVKGPFTDLYTDFAGTLDPDAVKGPFTATGIGERPRNRKFPASSMPRYLAITRGESGCPMVGG